MPQRQQNPNTQQHSRMLFIPNTVLRGVADTQSTPYCIYAVDSLFNYNLSHQPAGSAQAALRQTYQSNLPYRGYQKAEKKRVYQVHGGPAKNQPESFYTIFENKSKNVIYSDKGFEEVTVNFVGIETLYNNYSATFFFRSKLHNYLKKGRLELTLSPFHCFQGYIPVFWL